MCELFGTNIDKIIIFGSNGMLGNYIASYFKKQDFHVIEITRNEYNAVKNTNDYLEKLLVDYNINSTTIIFNAIGIIPQRLNKKNKAYHNRLYIKINSIFPNILNQICKKYGAKFIHPSTDCVYSGLKGNYNEQNIHNSTDLYGVSKSLGETDCTIIRVSIIGEEKYNKKSLLEWVKSNKNKNINGYINHYWNGITCLQYAKIVYHMVINNIFWKGVRHIKSPNIVSKYELINIINTVYDLNIKINKTYVTERGKSKRNMHNVLIRKKCDRTLSTIYSTNDIFDIHDLKSQIIELKNYDL